MDFIKDQLPSIFILAFLSIAFLQSGIDKIVDWKGNLSWLNGHFEKTFLAKNVALALGSITILEIAAGALSAFGIFEILFMETTIIAWLGAALSALSLLMLFFGQRIAKDYPGAMTLAIYFIIAVAGMIILGN